MPQTVEVPGIGDVEFPDGMTDDAIVSAIQRNAPPRQARALDAATWAPDPLANAYNVANQQYREQYGQSPDPFGAHDTAFTLALFHQFPEDATRVSKAAVADAAAGMGAAFMPGYTLKDAAKASGNLPAAFKREPLPIDEQMRDAALEAQQRGQVPWEATTAKVSQGVSGTLPLMLGMAALPASAQRLAMAGFAYSMMKDAPEVARALGSELGKPPELQDPDKISSLVSEAIQITGFAPLSAVGAARGGPAKWNAYAKEKGLPTIPDAALKPIKPLDWAIEQARKIPVQVQPKTAPKYERAKVPEAEAEKAQAQAEREAEQGIAPPGTPPPEPVQPEPAAPLVVPPAAPIVPAQPAEPQKVETPFGPGVVQNVQHGGELLDVKLEGGESRLVRAEDVMAKEPVTSDLDLARSVLENEGKLGISLLQRRQNWGWKRAEAAVKALEDVGEIVRPDPAGPWVKPPKAEPTPEPAAVVEPVAWEDTKPADDWLKVEAVDPGPVKDVVRGLYASRDALNTKMQGFEKQIKDLEKAVTYQTGPKYQRGRVKPSAPKKALAEYNRLKHEWTETGRAKNAIEEQIRQTQAPVEVFNLANRVNDPKLNTLARYMARNEHFYATTGKPPPEAFSKALTAETYRVAREYYPDATEAELKQMANPVQAAAMHGDVKRSFEMDPQLNLNARRRGEVRAAYNEVQRVALTQDFSSDVAKEARAAWEGKELSRSRADELIRRIGDEAKRVQAKQAAEAAEAVRVADEMESKFTTVIETDAVKSGKQAKEKLVGALKTALEKAPEEAAGKANVTIKIPGDGEFKIHNTKAQIAEVLERAERLDTRKNVYNKAPSGGRMDAGTLRERDHRAAVEVYGDIGNAYRKLAPQLARAAELELSPEQTDRLGRLVEELKNSIEAPWRQAVTELRRAEERLEFALKPGRVVADAKTVKEAKAAVSHWTKEVMSRRVMMEGELGNLGDSGGSAGTKASPAMRSPGGELGEPPRAPADDPRHSVFDAVPMEMPEAVRVIKALTGAFPRIRERLRALGGQAAGVFKFREGEGARGRVELRADLFDLLTREEKNALKNEAFDYAKATAKSDAEFRNIYRERYKFLLDEAYQAAKSRNPILALKVIWHEIGHVVDWLPDNLISGRGNLFGRLATLKNYFKSTLPLDPTKPSGEKLTDTDKARLEREALKQLRAEFGPMREIIRKIIIEEPEFKILGITPQDVINIMGEFAGKDTPELTRWFSEQSREVKADVLRKAMRGMLDERLAALGKKVQTGTRKTEKTVRERVGREPTPAEVRARFAELLAQEIKARNLADLQTVKKELEGAIAWWRGTEKMEDYFKPSEEMYAEAFSIFANNPAALEARAPTYAKLIWNYMDRKPAVRALYDQIQADIKAGNIMPGRVKGLYEMWDGDDARSLRVRKESLATSVGDFYDNVRYHFDRRFGPIYSTAKGYVQEGALREAVGTFLYRATEHERFLADVNNSVGKTLVANNLDWSHDLGEYLFHKRVTNERFNIANPLGWTSKNSLERLAEMQRNLGPDRWTALESAAATFHALQQKYVVDPVVASGMFTEEVGELLKTNLDYATFQAVKDVPDKGIEKLLMMRYGANVTPHIFRQIGNLGEVKNPATATVLKGLSLITAVYRNTMKREVVRMIREQDPDNIMPARMRWNGKFREPVILDNHPTVGTVIYMHGGKPQAVYVRKLLADAVNQGNPTENLLFRSLIKVTGWQKGLFTQLNYAFWPVNFVRDTMGAMMQLPGTFSGLGLLKQYPKALRAARDSVTHARPNEAADAVLKRKMVISQSDPRGIWAAAENEYELKLASFGMDPAQWSREAGKVHGLVKAWNYYRELGQTGERVNKIAGMLYLDEKFPTMPEWKKRQIVRERSGSPNFLERGASNPAVDLFWLFYNPWKEGVRSVAKSAVENPFSFGSKAVAFVLLPTIIQAAAVNGWLGEDTRKRYRSVPDYYLSNYLLPWVDWADKDQGKVAALKLPLWEPARIAHGALFRLLTGRGTGLMSHAGGQLPSMNPIWQVGLAWSEYMLGKNPYDVSRGVNVLTDTEQQTRGPQGDVFVGEPLAEMGKFSWNEMGGSILHRFRNLNLESPPANDAEKFLGLPIVNNALGRWVTVTDRGNIDEARLWTGKTTAHQADVRLACQQIGDKLLSGQALTSSERMVMRDPYAVQYLEKELLPRLIKDRAAPLFRQLEVAPTSQGKAEVLREASR